jgi:hypothetical protein
MRPARQSLACRFTMTIETLSVLCCMVGRLDSLVERCNAAAGHYSSALRVSLSSPTDCVAPLDKGVARAGPASAASALGLACEARLAVNDDKLTELAIITLNEH